MTTISKPAAWDSSTMEDLLGCAAGRAYVLDQLDAASQAIQPEHTFRSDDKRSDACWYEIYEDGSMWFVNNAEDEVWVDYRDFVQDCLIPCIEAANATGGLCWGEVEYDLSGKPNAFKLDAMDRGLLLHYHDNDVAEAMESIGL